MRTAYVGSQSQLPAISASQELVSMVRLSAQNLESPVDLLDQQQPDQPMRDGDPSERDQPIGSGPQGLRVTVGSSDRERDGPTATVGSLAGEQARYVGAGDLLASLIESAHQRGRGNRGDELGLVFDFDDVDGRVRAQPLDIFGLGRLEVGLLQAADGQDADPQ
jgi:hypothetical protein